MQDLLDSTGFDIRVAANDPIPGEPDIADGPAAAAQIAALPSVSAAIAVRTEDADIQLGSSRPTAIHIRRRLRRARARPGRSFAAATFARRASSSSTTRRHRPLAPAPGRASASRLTAPAAPRRRRRSRFRSPALPNFRSTRRTSPAPARPPRGSPTPAARLTQLTADLVMVTSTGDPDAAAAAIAALRPDLRAFTNDQAVGQLQQRGFTYFRQISTVLTTITVSFALLLITRAPHGVGEPAARRGGRAARARLLAAARRARRPVRVGADRRHRRALSLPLGAALAVWLDGILKRMPNLPAALHFFVFDPQALVDPRRPARRHRRHRRALPDAHRRPPADRGDAPR